MKTTPTLTQVRSAVREEIGRFDADVKALEQHAQVGYRGSVAAGAVGNPSKLHYGMEPDIRGECGVRFDIDGFLLASEIVHEVRPDKAGKRWAARWKPTRILEARMRSALVARPELEHMKGGRAGFELLLRPAHELPQLMAKGPLVIVIR